MRIHTTAAITPRIIANEASAARATAYEIHRSGSRSHAVAYDVHLEGSNPRRAQHDRDRFAATYDQWGHFLAGLYRIDPTMKAGSYQNVEHFNAMTNHAF